jgi:hypothetical protein
MVCWFCFSATRKPLVRSEAKGLPVQYPGLSLIPLRLTGNNEVESEG